MTKREGSPIRVPLRALITGTALVVAALMAVGPAAQAQEALGTVDVTITNNAVGADGTERFDWYDVDGGAGRLVEPGESVTYTVDQHGALLLEQLAPVAWEAESLICDEAATSSSFTSFGVFASFEISVGTSDVACTITNIGPHGTSIVPVGFTLNAEGGDGTEIFDFSTPHGVESIAAGHSFAIDALPGTVEVTQMLPGAWQLTGFDCTGTESEAAVTDAASATYSLTVADQPIDCTINLLLPPPAATIVITAATNGIADDTAFAFIGPDGTPFTLIGGETIVFDGLDEGSYAFAIDAGQGRWKLASGECGDADHAATVAQNGRSGELSVSVVPGDEVTCTVTFEASAACSVPGRGAARAKPCRTD